VVYNVKVHLHIILCVFVVCQSFLTGTMAAAPAVGSGTTRLSNSTSVPTSYFTPVGNNNNNNSSSSTGSAQFVRVVTSNTPIQPKLLSGRCRCIFHKHELRNELGQVSRDYNIVVGWPGSAHSCNFITICELALIRFLNLRERYQPGLKLLHC